MDRAVTRRIAGTAALVLVFALAFAWLTSRYQQPSGTITITAEMGNAGSGLVPGSDVKFLGVRVGRVAALDYTDGRATARIQVFPQDVCLPAPSGLELVVTAKTLLGEKQVELSAAEGHVAGEEPCLAEDDHVVAAAEPTELQAVIDELNRVFGAIDPDDLAAIFEAFAQQRGEEEVLQENIRLGSELSEFGARTAEQNIANLRKLAGIAEALEPRARDLTRLNANLDEATAILREREGDLSDTLQVTLEFSTGLAEFLETSEGIIDGLMQSGDIIGGVLEDNQDSIGSLIEGLILYGQGLGRGGLLLDDGSEWAPFKVFLSFDFEGLLNGLVP